MIESIKEDIAQINRNTNTDKTSTSLEKAKGHIQEFLECGLSDVDNPSNISTYPNNENFFGHNSLSKALLVDLAGIEPASESSSIIVSPITVSVLSFPTSRVHLQTHDFGSLQIFPCLQA